jgi:hypothetical protein
MHTSYKFESLYFDKLISTSSMTAATKVFKVERSLKSKVECPMSKVKNDNLRFLNNGTMEQWDNKSYLHNFKFSYPQNL